MSDSSLDDLSAKITQFINQSESVVAEANSKIDTNTTTNTNDDDEEQIVTGPLEDSISPEPETLNRIDDCFDDSDVDQFQPLDQIQSVTSINKSVTIAEASTTLDEPVEEEEVEQSAEEEVAAVVVVQEENDEVAPPKTTTVNQSCEVKSLDTSYGNVTKETSRCSSSLAKMSHHTSTDGSESRATSDIIRRRKNVSALESIEVKSVSSTTSSKFGVESRMFENTELWKFVRQFIPPEHEHQVRQKLQDEVSQYSGQSRPGSSRSSNPLGLEHLKQQAMVTPPPPPPPPMMNNKSGKSIVSEQRFMDGIADSPVGSHKSSTPDHSLVAMDGWKYTRDSEYITGSIKVAESDSKSKSSITSRSASHSTISSMSTHTAASSNTADELSQRVRNLLKEIDTSLDESEPSPRLPKLILGIDETTDQVKQGLRSFHSNTTTTNTTGSMATPRSIEDLTTDEKYGSFMPQSHASRSPDSAACIATNTNTTNTPAPPLALEIEDLENDDEEEKIIDPVEMLEKDQLTGLIESESMNTTSQLKSEDAEAPSFPSEAYGTQQLIDQSIDRTHSTMYQKQSANVSKNAKNVSFVEPNSSVRVAEVEETIDSVQVKEVKSIAEQTNNESALKSIAINEDDSTINESVASSTASFQVAWFPRNMAEFKKLTREQKKELLQALRRAAKKKKQSAEQSILSDNTSVTSSNDHRQMNAIFDKWHTKQEIIPSPSPPAPTVIALDEDKIINSLKSNIAALVRDEIHRLKPATPPPPPQVRSNYSHSEHAFKVLPSASKTNSTKKSMSERAVTMSTSPIPPVQPEQHSIGDHQHNHTGRLEQLEAQLASLKRQEQLEEEKIQAERTKLMKTPPTPQKEEVEKENVSFCVQCNESEIEHDMRILRERNQDPSLPRELTKSSMATQTIMTPVKPAQAWYAPVYTEKRKHGLLENALDPQKRLSSAVKKKASLQEAFLINQQEFISRSRSRVRHVKLKRDQRLVEKELEKERIKVFGDYKAGQNDKMPKFHPISATHSLGERRPVNLKEARRQTTEKYNQLPEVIARKKREKYQREKVANNLKVQTFNRKIQSKVLSKL